MKKIILTSTLLIVVTLMSLGQSTDPLVSQCVMNAGTSAKYLKDFRIQLGKAENQTDLRYKANMSLWKNTKYRFSMCNAESSQGKLILIVKDDTNKQILSSYDKTSGKIYPYVDFTCNRSGIYQLCFDFENGEPGSGVGVVSMVR